MHAIRTLVQTLEQKNPHYALGWLESMIENLPTDLNMTNKQKEAFDRLLQNNIRWAKD